MREGGRGGAVNGSQLPFEISACRNDELAGNGNGKSCLRADGVSRVRGPGVDGGGEHKRDSGALWNCDGLFRGERRGFLGVFRNGLRWLARFQQVLQHVGPRRRIIWRRRFLSVTG